MQLTLGPALGVAITVLAVFAALFIRLGMLGRPRDVLTAVARAALQLAAVSLAVGVVIAAVRLLVLAGLLAVQALAVLITVELVAAGCFSPITR